MSAETDQMMEEAEKEERAEKEEAVEEREAPPQVIEIHAPPPFHEKALEPFVDIFMEKRGLTDKKQAAVKLANVLWNMGYDPRRDIQNVTTYINNLSTVLNAIPDTDETAPVKGALLARGATDVSGMLKKAHFGTPGDEMSEIKEILRYGMRINMAMRALDAAFRGGENTASNPEVATLKEQVKLLREKLEKNEEKHALDEKLAPIRQQMNAIMSRLDALTTQPKTAEEPALSKEVKQMLDAMNKRLDALDQRYQFTQEIQGIRNEITALKTNLENKGKTPGDVSDVFDQAVKLMDKITEVTKKYGGSEGELDWRVAGISAASEIATEAIGAARDIYAQRPREVGEKPQPKTEGISEKIVERRLLSYIQQRAAEGAVAFNSLEAAKAIGVSEGSILNAYRRLKEKGILRSVGEEHEEKTGKPKGKPAKPESWVEG